METTPHAALLLRGGRVFTTDGDLRSADVLIADGRIVAVGPAAGDSNEDATVIDAADRIVLPGLIDTHRHTWQTAIRGIGTNWNLNAYFAAVSFGIAPHFTPDDVYTGNVLGALAALDAGITTLVDWSHISNTPGHADAAVQALRDSGIRAVYAHGWPQTGNPDWVNESVLPHPADARRLRRELDDDTARVTMALALRGPEFSTEETVIGDMRMAHELGLRVTMHVGDGAYARYRAVAVLHRLGLLGPDVTLVHASASSDDELKMIADTGARVSVSPALETLMPGIGQPATSRLLSLGVSPSLSADTETAAPGDLFAVMRATLAAHRSQPGIDPMALTAEDVFAFATRDGAAAAGLTGRTGIIEAGYAADVILVRADDVNLAPEPGIGALVTSAHAGNVDTVIVEGVIVKRDGRLLHRDLDTLRSKAAQSRRRLLTHLSS
jgi:5-methylthioadenosine/S-adenosylhomocysteine deaminase